MRDWIDEALTGTSGVTSMGRVLLLATVGTHLTLVVVDVLWRLSVLVTVGRTPVPAYPMFSQQIALYMTFAFVVWVAGARWAKAWKESGLTDAIAKAFGGTAGMVRAWAGGNDEYPAAPGPRPGLGGDDPIRDDERDE